MKIEYKIVDGYAMVRAEGRADTAGSGEFERAMLEVLEQGCSKLLLDCSAMNYISSSGLRVLLIVQKKMSATGGSFILTNLQPGILEILEISGFTSIFTIEK